MEITVTGIKILKYLLNNNRRNRKITRSNMSREIGKSYAIIYKNSGRLLNDDLICYNKIDDKKLEVGLTKKGEEYILANYCDKI